MNRRRMRFKGLAIIAGVRDRCVYACVCVRIGACGTCVCLVSVCVVIGVGVEV
jgi:hypothetical protein